MKKQPKKFKKSKKAVVIQVFPPKATSIKFPSISRSIPELSSIRAVVLNKVFVVNFLCGFCVMAIGLFALQVKTHFYEVSLLQNKKAGIIAEKSYWENVVTTHPTYRDGYFKLATIEYRLGNTSASHEYTEKALKIDPDYTPAKTFKEEIAKR